MKLFEQKEITIIEDLLKQYIKENKKIENTADVMEYVKNGTDFYREQYETVEEIIDEYLEENAILKKQTDINYIIKQIEEAEEGEKGIFTKSNTLVAVITMLLGYIATMQGDNLFILIGMAITLILAYISRYIGLQKGIQSGFVWGYFLGILGFIVVCVLKGEEQEEKIVSNSNKYENLEKLQKLKETGTITEEEFKAEKEKLLR